jgi:hypothetical protein
MPHNWETTPAVHARAGTAIVAIIAAESALFRHTFASPAFNLDVLGGGNVRSPRASEEIIDIMSVNIHVDVLYIES